MRSMMRLSRFITGLTITLMLATLSAGVAKAATHNAASCAQADVQNAVNSAVSGDVVVVSGPCSASWNSPVTIPNTKGITVQASGTVTLTGHGFALNQNSSVSSRITGFAFTNQAQCGTGSATPIQTDGSTSTAPFRIDHNTFTSSAQSIFVCLNDNGPGLVDHNTFTGGGASEEIHNLGMGAGSNSGWTDNVTPGSANMVVIEDNTFATSDNTFICSGIESYYGSRNALRHNTFNFCQIDQHGTAGSVGARWWEAYNNNFFTPSGQNQCCYVVMRGGTGVVWGNTTSGSNGVNGTIAFVEEDSGTWPLAYQIGSGINGDTNGHNSCGSKNSSPAYAWGNAATMPYDIGGPQVQLNRDIFTSSSQPSTMSPQELTTQSCSTAFAYTPFAYPYPLDANGLPSPNGGRSSNPPSPPTGFAAAVN